MCDFTEENDFTRPQPMCRRLGRQIYGEQCAPSDDDDTLLLHVLLSFDDDDDVLTSRRKWVLAGVYR